MKRSSGSQFAQCRSCGARIIWMKTAAGKNMPVDPTFVYYKEQEGGKDRIVLPNGEVVAGKIQETSDGATGYGYISHFATCPNYRR